MKQEELSTVVEKTLRDFAEFTCRTVEEFALPVAGPNARVVRSAMIFARNKVLDGSATDAELMGVRDQLKQASDFVGTDDDAYAARAAAYAATLAFEAAVHARTGIQEIRKGVFGWGHHHAQAVESLSNRVLLELVRALATRHKQSASRR